MNPRVSRSSALASKATGFPIAKIAAKLAVGYTLDEIRNDITRETPASFEPTIDYVVTKIPRFTFEKFPAANSELTTQMKSVGEAMAIGRTFKESFQKAIRSLEIGHTGFEPPGSARGTRRREDALGPDRHAEAPGRPWAIMEALRRGASVEGSLRAHEDRSAGSCATSPRSRRREARLGEASRGGARAAAETRSSRWDSPTRVWRRSGASARPTVRELRHRLGIRPGLQAGRHLRGRVRGPYAVSLLDLRG